MQMLRHILLELWGLFIDDASLALVLILCLAAIGIAARTIHTSETLGPLFAVGILLLLAENVIRAGRARKRR